MGYSIDGASPLSVVRYDYKTEDKSLVDLLAKKHYFTRKWDYFTSSWGKYVKLDRAQAAKLVKDRLKDNRIYTHTENCLEVFGNEFFREQTN